MKHKLSDIFNFTSNEADVLNPLLFLWELFVVSHIQTSFKLGMEQ